jgi:Competence-damaged protein
MPYHLNYHDALANDLPIGSGEIESAHRYLRSNAWNGQAPGGAVDHAVFGDFNGILHRRHDRGRSLARRRRRRIPAWRLRDVYEGTQTSALGLSADLLREKGAVNEEVVTQLARGALKHSPASVSLAVSGVLGPEEDEDGNPVGLVYFCCARSGGHPVVVKEEFGKKKPEQLLQLTIARAFSLRLGGRAPWQAWRRGRPGSGKAHSISFARSSIALSRFIGFGGGGIVPPARWRCEFAVRFIKRNSSASLQMTLPTCPIFQALYRFVDVKPSSPTDIDECITQMILGFT